MKRIHPQRKYFQLDLQVLVHHPCHKSKVQDQQLRQLCVKQPLLSVIDLVTSLESIKA